MSSTLSYSSERFHQVRLLGEGATSQTFEVQDTVSSARYALKTQKPARTGGYLRRLQREQHVLNRISHPNVVRSLELIVHGAKPALLLELITGVDFHNYVRPDEATRPRMLDTCTGSSATPEPGEVGRGGTWVESRLRSALKQLAEGLTAVHAAKYVHCDIKPDNVLVTSRGRLVIVDFGSACSPGYLPGLCRGTPGFMAPEQQAGVLSAAVDWYGVGVLLYCALTGRLPLGAGAMGPPLSYAEPLDPHLLAAELPDDLVQLALRLLDPDPHTRASGRDVIRVAEGRPVATALNRAIVARCSLAHAKF